MSLPVVLWAEAEDELQEGYDFFENQRLGLGDDFVAEVEGVFRRISVSPKLHAIVYKDVRKAVVPQFPYCVYYLAEPKEVAIVSVFHTSRDPSVWQGRR
ncbi:type II toxin-antitoxin system RelE/ParE family toxin [Limnoglobus roseus]|uniref:Type II toxin-antitoxin system RelE/ParE family toxin n=1 Tax=Limnoglobus roseus TaxID=2598579 RepID=A0A5C1A713_9BACT|nr:type II toxin-antitoxin system RelE/ParE family toxin [Limnoglobus roseus]QEL13967.1 type II toxin-antitoxin system RelE/ParE family toxin [Limnoglobus roseus]